MSDPSTLVDFVEWGKTNYPAPHYALILSDHGSGVNGAMQDWTSGYSLMSVQQIGDALASITAGGDDKLDVLYLDSCLMAMIEDGYEFKVLRSLTTSPARTCSGSTMRHILSI